MFSRWKRNETSVSQNVEDGNGHFEDKVTVHTAPSGTQYVLPIDVLIDEDEMQQFVRTARTELEQQKNQPAKVNQDK